MEKFLIWDPQHTDCPQDHHPHPLRPAPVHCAGVSLGPGLELFRGEQDALLAAGQSAGSPAQCGAQQSAHAAPGRQYPTQGHLAAKLTMD